MFQRIKGDFLCTCFYIPFIAIW